MDFDPDEVWNEIHNNKERICVPTGGPDILAAHNAVFDLGVRRKCFLDRYGLEAESCVFIDDTEENVTAAKALGFSGIVFTSYKDLIDELKNISETKP